MSLPSSMADFVPRDRQMQKAYSVAVADAVSLPMLVLKQVTF